MSGDDPFAVLGLEPTATAESVRAAQRSLAKLHHPDAGGDDERMRRINAAAVAALREIDERAPEAAPAPPAAAPRAAERTGASAPRPGATHFSDVRRDMPSFVVEALPVETFESLLIVAGWLGDVIDDDPPYRLDVRLAPIDGLVPADTWCRLDLVPDAGASTVSLTAATEVGAAPPDVDAVRDVWVHALNELDWEDR